MELKIKPFSKILPYKTVNSITHFTLLVVKVILAAI